jgi:copper chaperone CopZ
MQTKLFEIPALYGDHHVVEVRRILLETPGVKDVYASSAFQAVEVTYDPKEVNDLQLQTKLQDAGYLGDWSTMRETNKPVGPEDGQQVIFRHTVSYQNTRKVVSFGRKTEQQGRPLWPCPGMGVVSKTMDE